MASESREATSNKNPALMQPHLPRVKLSQEQGINTMTRGKINT